MHGAEPSVPEQNSIEAKIYKSPGTDEISAELVQVGGNILRSESHIIINSISNKEELPQQWKEFITVLIYKKDD
jgi:hypothetical protein